MKRGTSFTETERYLESVFATCSGFELLVLTAVEAESLTALREQLVAQGAELSIAEPTADAVLEAPRMSSDAPGPCRMVRWIEGGSNAAWREFASVLNRSRERLRAEHAYLWVLAGSRELRRFLRVHAQDIYSGALKAPHVTEHVDAAFNWLHLSTLALGHDDSVVSEFCQFLLRDLILHLDLWEIDLDLVLISGDVGEQGRAQDYARVETFFDRLLRGLQAHRLAPLVLSVPGPRDLSPPAPNERSKYEVLRHHDADDEQGRSLRERLWRQRDASLIEPLFAAYQAWTRRQTFDSLRVDEVGMAPGVCHVRAIERSHMPGDWSLIVEKDDFRLGLVGLNTVWANVGHPSGRGQLPHAQFEAALGPAGVTWLSEVHQWVMSTYHSPRELAEAARATLIERIYSIDSLRAHLYTRGDETINANRLARPKLLHVDPLAVDSRSMRFPRSAYCLTRLMRDGRIEARWRSSASRGVWRDPIAPG